jgi:hypothetical protein
LGIGDWGLGIGPNPQSPIPNPQSPIPNPQFKKLIIIYELIHSNLKNKIFKIHKIFHLNNNPYNN